jgi:uncharacterized protein (UPF0297 family)
MVDVMDKNDQSQSTILFNSKQVEEQKVRKTLELVDVALQEKGYDSINQIVGYLISNDPAYISSHNQARKVIQEISRDEIIEELVRRYLDKK